MRSGPEIISFLQILWDNVHFLRWQNLWGFFLQISQKPLKRDASVQTLQTTTCIKLTFVENESVTTCSCAIADPSRGRCAYRLLILHLPDAQVLQWDDSSRLLVLHKTKRTDDKYEHTHTSVSSRRRTHCGVFKVVQTVVCEDEPSPLPGLHSSS